MPQRKQNFIEGAAVLTLAVAVTKVIGAVYKIPLGNLLDKDGMAHFYVAYNIYIMEELHSILSLGAGGSTKMVDPAAGRIERVFHAKYPNEYITRPEKIQKNLQEFSAFYRSMKK